MKHLLKLSGFILPQLKYKPTTDTMLLFDISYSEIMIPGNDYEMAIWNIIIIFPVASLF